MPGRVVCAPNGELDEYAQSSQVDSWPDARLILAVRCDPPDEEALDVLVARHWDALFGCCQMLTLNREKARDLAQAAWCRLLRARHTLKTDGNLPAYLATIATNLFRDSHRSARRAGPLSESQMVSLDVATPTEEGASVFLESILPDPNVLRADEQARLRLDIDEGLALLTPLLREVLVARYITGESCVEIGLRHGRAEQTISGWVREAIRQMKAHLEDPIPQGNLNP